jgi:hypothetical protein
MIRLIGEHWEGDVRERMFFDDVTQEYRIERWQDGQSAVDLVAAVNAEGAPTVDGLGKPVAEIPQLVWIEWCAQRGLEWEKLYSGPELDNEFKRCVAEHSKLAYRTAKRLHTVQ